MGRPTRSSTCRQRKVILRDRGGLPRGRGGLPRRYSELERRHAEMMEISGADVGSGDENGSLGG